MSARTLIVLTAIAASVSVQVLAQRAAQPAGQAPAGLVATTNNPNLSVATVRLDSGIRSSKIIGAPVFIDGNEKAGTVDDLIITADNKVTVAVIAIGGVMGMGAKLIAVPFTQLTLDGDKAVLAGVSKDALNAMPTFLY